ncbi:MAG: HEAT-like repeat protein [Pedosphaera sp.]|nr:HEAT-like repeat protein [Pedosphaera sp.]
MNLFHIATMKKRFRIGFGLLLVGAVGGVAWLALRPGEPMYKGKRLSVWLKVYDSAAGYKPYSPARQKEADDAIRSIGTNAIPTLLRRIRAKDSASTLWLVSLAEKQRVFKVKFRYAWILHVEGKNGFRALGAGGKDAVPELIRIFEQDHSTESREDVAEVLNRIGSAAELAVPALVLSLGDTKSHYRVPVIQALREIHARPEIVLPAMVKCASDQNTDVRVQAILTMGAFGSDSRQAVPDLVKLLSDSNYYIRDVAKAVLLGIDPEAAAKMGLK